MYCSVLNSALTDRVSLKVYSTFSHPGRRAGEAPQDACAKLAAAREREYRAVERALALARAPGVRHTHIDADRT